MNQQDSKLVKLGSTQDGHYVFVPQSPDEEKTSSVEDEHYERKLLACQRYVANLPLTTRNRAPKARPGRKARGKSGGGLIDLKSKSSYSGETAPYAFALRNRANLPKRDVVTIALQTTLQASAGGVIATVISNTAMTASSNWSAIAATFQMYRVKRMEFLYIPLEKYDLSPSTVTSMLVVGNDYELATATSTYNGAVDYDNYVVACSGDQFRAEMNFPMQAPWGTWSPTSAPVASGWMKFYGAGFGNAQIAGSYVIRFELEVLGLT